MHKVTKDFQDGMTKEFHKAGDLIEVAPWRVEALGDFIEPVEYFKKQPQHHIIESAISFREKCLTCIRAGDGVECLVI